MQPVFKSMMFTLGINIPLSVALMSRIEEASGLAPVVLTPTFWAKLLEVEKIKPRRLHAR